MDKIVPVLETERLTFRGMTLEDTETIVAWRSDRSVYQYFLSPHKLSEEEHTMWYEREYLVDTARMEWICSRKDNGEDIGVFGIKRDKGRREEAEISYLLSEKSRGFGFGAEAVTGITQWCEENGIMRLKAMVHEKNCRSIRFIERMGFCENGKQGQFILYEKEILSVRGGYWVNTVTTHISGICLYQAAA